MAELDAKEREALLKVCRKVIYLYLSVSPASMTQSVPEGQIQPFSWTRSGV